MTPIANIEDRMQAPASDTAWPPRRAFIPAGCDQQGRHPEAAHAASELTDDDEAKRGEGAGVFIWPLLSTLFMFAVLLVIHLWAKP